MGDVNQIKGTIPGLAKPLPTEPDLKIVIRLNGGLIDTVYINKNIKVAMLVIDPDTEGAEDNEIIKIQKQEYYARFDAPIHYPELVQVFHNAYNHKELKDG